RPVRSAHSARAAACTATATARTTLATGTGSEHRLRLHRQEALALQLLAGQLARSAHGFGLFAGFFLGGRCVMAAELHVAENSLTLHLLLQRLEGLIDVVIANENLHAASSFGSIDIYSGKGSRAGKSTSPPVLSARLYQTKGPMSTARCAIRYGLSGENRASRSANRLLKASFPPDVRTCVRPGSR